MGINGGLVRSVFKRNRSFGTHESNVKSNMTERRRWRSSVRSYLCGDEYNSVLADNDSASIKSSVATSTQLNSLLVEDDSNSAKSSEATVTQPKPMLENLRDKDGIESQGAKENVRVGNKECSVSATMYEEEEEQAATIIQLAFRGFLTRRQNEGIITSEELSAGAESPSRESLGTSVEVQTGNSVEVYSIQQENIAAQHRMQQKARGQALKLKEEWDDSTVSTNISKMRIQNRLEASTRRQRALAYAFSQQLRICSKKKHATTDGTEQNMGWNWLERWMATRPPEISSVESHVSSPVEAISSNQRLVIGKRLFVGEGEEKESCGSNEVSILFDSFPVTTTAEEKDGFSPARNRLKATRSLSRRKSMPSYECGKEYSKVSKKDCLTEAEREREQSGKQTERIKCRRNTSF